MCGKKLGMALEWIFRCLISMFVLLGPFYIADYKIGLENYANDYLLNIWNIPWWFIVAIGIPLVFSIFYNLIIIAIKDYYLCILLKVGLVTFFLMLFRGLAGLTSFPKDYDHYDQTEFIDVLTNFLIGTCIILVVKGEYKELWEWIKKIKLF
jgi:hypothetical protein